MQKLNLNIRKISLLMSLGFLFFSCSKNDDIVTNDTKLNENTITFNREKTSGEDVFLSIFCGIGKYTANVKQLNLRNEAVNQLSPKAKLEFIANMNQLINLIKREDTNYFINFKKDISSGNHQEVKLALQNTAKLVYSKIGQVIPDMVPILSRVRQDACNGEFENFDRDGNIDKYITDFKNRPLPRASFDNLLNQNMISDNSGRPCSWGIVCVAYFALAVHNTFAITAVAGVYLGVTLWGPSISQYSGSSGGSGGGSGGSRGPSPIVADIPTNTNQANLKLDLLIDEITLFYA